jgi:transcriptional regulator with XRE-family HTH domain
MDSELTFGRWLHDRRHELGVTRDELSDQLGFSRALLRKLESGERHPSGQVASLLADYFRIPPGERDAFTAFARAGRSASPADDVSEDASSSSPWRVPAVLTSLIGRDKGKRSRTYAHGLIILAIALVALGYTWPLITHLTVAVPGRPGFPDVTEYVWSVGWVHHALTSSDSLMYTDALFVPLGADLRLNTFGLLQGLIAFPLIGWLGVVGAYNFVLVASLFLNGAVTYALIHYHVRHQLAAFCAAVWFMLATPLLAQIGSGRSALGAVWIVSGALLALGRLFDRPDTGRGVVLGLVLLAALVTDFQIVLFTAIWLLLYCVYRVWRGRQTILTRATVGALGLAGLIVGAPFFLFYYAPLVAAQAAGYPKPALADMSVYSFSYWHYVTPDLIPAVYGGFETLVAIIAALLIFRWRGPYRFWLVAALVFLLLALGPYLQPTRIPLPFAIFSLWEPLAQFRTPSRFLMAAMIGFAIVAGFVLAALLTRVRSRVVILTLVGVACGGRFLFAVLHDPMQVQTYPEYQTYRQIASEPGDFTLLEVPFGIRSGLERIGSGGEVVQYYQHIHGKRLISGSMARLPSTHFTFYRAHPSLLFLAGAQPHADVSDLDRDFAEVLGWSGARYLLVHRSLLTPQQVVAIEQFLDRQPQIERLGLERDLVVYQVRGRQTYLHPKVCRTQKLLRAAT